MNGKSKLGWLLTLGSCLAIFVGIIMISRFIYIEPIYQLGLTLILLIGGLGLFGR